LAKEDYGGWRFKNWGISHSYSLDHAVWAGGRDEIRRIWQPVKSPGEEIFSHCLRIFTSGKWHVVIFTLEAKGLIDECNVEGLLLTGPGIYGLADPAQNAAICLNIITSLLYRR